MRILALSNLKGGVGKTTTAINLATGFAERGKKVLVIDVDGQGNATGGSVSMNDYDIDCTIAECLSGLVTVDECIVKTRLGYDLIPAKISLFAVEKNILNDPSSFQQAKLSKIISQVRDRYDYVIIDCNPSLNILVTNAIYACKDNGMIIIPIKLERYALEGYKLIKNTIESMNENFGLDVKYRILITMKNRNNLDKSVMEELQKLEKDYLFKTAIRYQAKPITAASYKRQAVICNKQSGVGADYRELIDELLEG